MKLTDSGYPFAVLPAEDSLPLEEDIVFLFAFVAGMYHSGYSSFDGMFTKACCALALLKNDPSIHSQYYLKRL